MKLDERTLKRLLKVIVPVLVITRCLRNQKAWCMKSNIYAAIHTNSTFSKRNIAVKKEFDNVKKKAYKEWNKRVSEV